MATAASSTSSDASVPGDMATASADATAASSTSVPGYVTTNSPQNVHKIGKQLVALGCAEISASHRERKVFFSAPHTLYRERLAALYGVERLFLAVFDHEIDEAACSLFGAPPDWPLLEGWLASALPRAARAWADIVGAPPATWSLDAARRGAKGSRCHSSLDKVELQHRARASVAAALPGVQHVRSDEAADLALHLVVSPVRVSAGIELLTRRVRKGYLPHKGLHHSVSWGLARTAALRPGEVALDACCGTAALLVEASVYFPDVSYVGIDASPEQLAKAAANVASHPRGAAAAARLTLLRGDAGALPVRRRSVDACVCDLPFGRQHGDADSNRVLYVRLLAELGCVLRPPRGRAVLLAMGATSEALVDASVLEAAGLVLHAAVPLRFGSMDCRMVLLRLAAAAPPPADDTPLFDEGFAERAGGDPRHSWKLEKPVLVPRAARAPAG